MYAGRTEKGLRLFALDVGAALVGGLSARHLNRDTGGGDRSAPLVVGAIGGFVVALGTHIYSIATAPGDAHAYNAERHPVAVLSPVFEQRNRHAAVGLALVLR